MMGVLASHGLPAETVFDGYKVLRKLGSGGFGAVHQVEKNCRLYALKLALLPADAQDDSKTHARTVRELLCLLLLEHPNIVRVHAHGHYPDEKSGHVYLVLDYVDGWTLAEWVERTHPTALELIRVFLKIAAAVAYMHGRGVFHRDLKLINVVIRKVDGEPILIDFGAASFAQAPELTGAGLNPMTERARAPEANRWWHLNKRNSQTRYDFRVTDELFAFGVMLYDALTDPRPSERRQRTAVNSLLVPPKDPQEHNPRIPTALATLVRRLLARDPAKRPESFEAVRRELAELLEHQGPEYRVPVHLPSAQVEALEPEAAAQAGKPPEAAPVKSRWRTRRNLIAWGAVGVAALAGVAAYTLSPALPPPVPAPDSIVSLPLEKEPSVKTQQSAQPLPLMQQDVPRFASEAERLTWCKAVGLGTVLALNAGCPGAQLRPEAPAECPDAVVNAMKEHGLKRDTWTNISFGPGDPPLMKQGRIEAEVWNTGARPPANLPVGTRLFGELWTAPDSKGYAYVRFDRVKLPSGTEFPVCIVLNDDGLVQVSERPAPGVIRQKGNGGSARVVYHWPELPAPLP